ncbi:MAG: hypothetical protein ACJ77M_13540 [Thermoleophilaceae bacterium]
MSELPDPATFLSGERGEATGVRARLGDVVLDARLALGGAARKLDRLDVPGREVLVTSVYRPKSERLAAELPKLESAHHEVRFAFGSTGEETVIGTVATNLGGGKFPNLNAVHAAAGAPEPDWTVIVDDDVTLPHRFLDRLVAACEHWELDLAQPAQTLRSHAAWPVTRRRGGQVVRQTRFVEIGPVTAMSRDVSRELMPFPALRYGWGLDAHWAAIAERRGWKLGVVDALPVRHEHAAVAAAYSSQEAIEEARRFLAERPYVQNAGL